MAEVEQVGDEKLRALVIQNLLDYGLVEHPDTFEKAFKPLIVCTLLPAQVAARSGQTHATFVVDSEWTIAQFKEFFFKHIRPYTDSENLIPDRYTFFPGMSIDCKFRLDFMDEEELMQTCWSITDNAMGVERKDRRTFRKVHANSFIGKDAIDWLIDRAPSVHNRRQALQVLRLMMAVMFRG
jgi:hypothetical protein